MGVRGLTSIAENGLPVDTSKGSRIPQPDDFLSDDKKLAVACKNEPGGLVLVVDMSGLICTTGLGRESVAGRNSWKAVVKKVEKLLFFKPAKVILVFDGAQEPDKAAMVWGRFQACADQVTALFEVSDAAGGETVPLEAAGGGSTGAGAGYGSAAPTKKQMKEQIAQQKKTEGLSFHWPGQNTELAAELCALRERAAGRLELVRAAAEADRVIAKRAAAESAAGATCWVVSSDSDFMVWPCVKGLVLLSSLSFDDGFGACKLIEPVRICGKIVARARDFVKAWAPPTDNRRERWPASCNQLGWFEDNNRTWKCRLAKHRPFKEQLLPDFACLVGNDFMKAEALAPFHEALGVFPSNLLLRVALFISLGLVPLDEHGQLDVRSAEFGQWLCAGAAPAVAAARIRDYCRARREYDVSSASLDEMLAPSPLVLATGYAEAYANSELGGVLHDVLHGTALTDPTTGERHECRFLLLPHLALAPPASPNEALAPLRARILELALFSCPDADRTTTRCQLEQNGAVTVYEWHGYPAPRRIVPRELRVWQLGGVAYADLDAGACASDIADEEGPLPPSALKAVFGAPSLAGGIGDEAGEADEAPGGRGEPPPAQPELDTPDGWDDDEDDDGGAAAVGGLSLKPAAVAAPPADASGGGMVMESWEDSDDDDVPAPAPAAPATAAAAATAAADGAGAADAADAASEARFQAVMSRLGPRFLAAPKAERRAALLELLGCSAADAALMGAPGAEAGAEAEAESTLLLQALALRLALATGAGTACVEAAAVAMLLPAALGALGVLGKDEARLAENELNRTSGLRDKASRPVLAMLSWVRVALDHVHLLNAALLTPCAIKPSAMLDGIVLHNCAALLGAPAATGEGAGAALVREVRGGAQFAKLRDFVGFSEAGAAAVALD